MTKSGSTGSAKKTPTTKDVQLTIGAPTSRRAIHPAMHFDPETGRAYFGFSLPVTTKIVDPVTKEEEKNSQADTPCLVSDKGETIPCVPSQLKSLGVTLAAQPEWNNVADNRISNPLLTAIIDGDKKTVRSLVDDIPVIFMKTVNNNGELVYLKDERWHEYLALWVFGTYVFYLFDAYPQIFLWGPRASAKTKIMNIIKHTAFNAELSPSMSPASLFRTVESCRATLLLDEMEKIGNKELFYEIRSLLLSGYKRGSTVKRTEPDGTGRFKQVRFQIYSPKMMANIDGIDQTLQDRYITINTQRLSGLRIPKNLKAIVNRRVTTSKRMALYQRLRDSCYVAAYDHWKTIDGLIQQAERDEDEDDVTARHLELWSPILVLARFFESFADKEPALEGLEQRMRDLLFAVIEEYRLNEADSNEHTLIRALWNIVHKLSEKDRLTVSYKEVRVDWTRIIEGIEDEEEDVSILPWMKGTYTGKMLRKLGFKKGELLRTGRGGVWHVKLTRKKVLELVEFYDVDTSEGDDEKKRPKKRKKGDGDSDDGKIQGTIPLSIGPEHPEGPASPAEKAESAGHTGETGHTGHTGRGIENSEHGEPAGPDNSTVSARAEPPLNDEVILMVLKGLKRAVTFDTLKREVVGLGYDGEEFEEVFKGMQDHPNIIKSKSGKSLNLYKFKESD